MSTVNEAKAEQFAEEMLETLNRGAICLLMSLGHRTGLFDALAELPPSTSDEIAQAANLHERYVREWLAGMVTAKYIEYYPDNQTYSLPQEHARWLTRSASPENIAVFGQYIPLLGSIEDALLECFENGGGVPYSEFNRFHDVMAEDSYQTIVSTLRESILPLVPGITEKLEQGIDVMDLGCGKGLAINLLAQWYPNSLFAGYDFSPEAIAAARELAKANGSKNIRFELMDAAMLDETERYDLITTFDAIHDQAQPGQVLRNIYKALRPNGTYLMQDIFSSSHLEENMDHPVGTLLYTLSVMHCMTVSLAQGGEGLGTMWGMEKARELLKAAGFQHIEEKRLAHDFQNVYFCLRK